MIDSSERIFLSDLFDSECVVSPQEIIRILCYVELHAQGYLLDDGVLGLCIGS
jgi:hypothetical protein